MKKFLEPKSRVFLRKYDYTEFVWCVTQREEMSSPDGPFSPHSQKQITRSGFYKSLGTRRESRLLWQPLIPTKIDAVVLLKFCVCFDDKCYVCSSRLSRSCRLWIRVIFGGSMSTPSLHQTGVNSCLVWRW